jgi:hypothetical protein
MSLKSFTRTTLAAAAVAAATFTAGATLGSNDAEARHRHHHRHHRHLALMWAAPVVIGAGYVGTCYALKVRAETTGSAYWYERYLACIGY